MSLDYERTEHNPLLDRGAVATGWKYISPCCTASVEEFLLPDGSIWCIGSVAGHGFSKPWGGTIADINEYGTIVRPDGTERRCVYDPSKDEPLFSQPK